jgi:hypothetical protein
LPRLARLTFEIFMTALHTTAADNAVKAANMILMIAIAAGV